VHKLTAMPAARLGLSDRGTVAPGQRADLVLFDPGSVSERGDYGHPDRPPCGIEHVFVNGEHAVAHGEVLRRDAGRVLRRGREATRAS